MSRASRRVGQGASQAGERPRSDPTRHAALAQLCEDAEGAMTFSRAARTLAELGGWWILESITRGYLALAEWLRRHPG